MLNEGTSSAKVGDPSGPELRRREVLESLDRHGVRFVLVGGQAAASHGALRPTRDLDICVLWTPENLDRVGAVLDEFDAGLRMTGDDEPMTVPHRDGRFLMKMDLSTWRSAAGDIDVLHSLPAPGGAGLRYERLMERAAPVSIDGVQVMVASLDDVIVSKEVADRPSDREALPELRSLRNERSS